MDMCSVLLLLGIILIFTQLNFPADYIYMPHFIPVTQTTMQKQESSVVHISAYKINHKFTRSMRVMYVAMFFNNRLLGRMPVFRRLSMYMLHWLTSSLIASRTDLVSTESVIHTTQTDTHTGLFLYSMIDIARIVITSPESQASCKHQLYIMTYSITQVSIIY